jgi:Fanconi anemia group I protein
VAQNDTLNTSATEQKKKKEKKKKKAVAAAPPGWSQALKESRCIPNLIFAMEQYERFLIQLANKSKVS